MGPNPQQAQVLALAVDVHQGLADFFQQRQTDGAPIDPAVVAPGGADFAPQDEGVGCITLQPFAFQYGVDVGLQTVVQAEDAFHLGPVGASADEGGVGTPAQQQAHGIDNDGLAGACLTGQHVEAGGETQVQLVDNREISDRQLSQQVSPFL